MRDVAIVIGLILGGIVLSALAWPLLVLAGIGVGVAGLFGGRTAGLVPAAFVAGALGVVGLLFRVVGAVAGAVLSVVVGIVSSLLPLLLILFGGWWLLRGSRRGRRPTASVA